MNYTHNHPIYEHNVEIIFLIILFSFDPDPRHCGQSTYEWLACLIGCLLVCCVEVATIQDLSCYMLTQLRVCRRRLPMSSATRARKPPQPDQTLSNMSSSKCACLGSPISLALSTCMRSSGSRLSVLRRLVVGLDSKNQRNTMHLRRRRRLSLSLLLSHFG